MRIEPITGAHADGVLAVYQAGIDEGNATFETRVPSWPEFSAARLPGHRFVAVAAPGAGALQPGALEHGAREHGAREHGVLGWVAVSAVSSRPVYAGVVEHSVYVHPHARGQGVGRALLGALIPSTEAAGIWTIESGIFPENAASLALHQAAGFRVVGTRQRIGCHQGRPGHPGGWWRDTVLIERRSRVAG